MTLPEFHAALKVAKDVYICSPCTGAAESVRNYRADDSHNFRITKTEARRVFSDMSDDAHVIATIIDGDLYIG